MTFDEIVRLAELKAADQARSGPADPELIPLLNEPARKVIGLITKHFGNLRTVAASLGVPRRQLIDYVLLRPHLQAIFGDRREELIDHAETQLHELVKQKRAWAIRLVIKILDGALGYTQAGDPDSLRLSERDLDALERLHGAVYGNAGNEAAPAAAGPASVPPAAKTLESRPALNAAAATPNPFQGSAATGTTAPAAGTGTMAAATKGTLAQQPGNSSGGDRPPQLNSDQMVGSLDDSKRLPGGPTDESSNKPMQRPGGFTSLPAVQNSPRQRPVSPDASP